MPQSTLTVRTLALATVAFVLACGHAVKAVGAQKAAADRAIVKTPSTAAPIRVIPAGSGHSTVATFSNTSSGGGRSGGSGVTTFTSKAGGGSASVVTFQGDRAQPERRIASNSAKPQPKVQANRKTGPLAPRGDGPLIAVRRISPADAPQNDPKDQPLMGPPAPEETPATVAAAKPAPRLRNAFAGLSSRTASASGEPLVYAHASAR